MADTPRLIRDFLEIDARADFDPDAPCTLENFASIVAPYRFPDDDLHACQVHKPELHKPDGRCGHLHFNGWLAKLKDGRTVLVGSSCGPKYFDAHETFKFEMRRIEREVDITDLMERLGELIGDRAACESDVAAAFARLRAARDSRKAIFERLPYAIRRTVENMARTGNSRVLLQIQYEETDENGKKHREWIDQPLGTVAGTNIHQTDLAQEASTKLWAMKQTLDEAVLDREAGYKTLKNWVETLGQMPSITTAIQEIEHRNQVFGVPENVGLLVYVDPNRNLQREVARLALELSGADQPTDAQAETFLRERDTAIRERNGGRNWRTHR